MGQHCKTYFMSAFQYCIQRKGKKKIVSYNEIVMQMTQNKLTDNLIHYNVVKNEHFSIN